MTVIELYKKAYPAKLFYISHTQGVMENDLGPEVQELLDYLGPVLDYKEIKAKINPPALSEHGF